MIGFQSRLRAAIQDAGRTDIYQLARDCDMGEKSIYNMLKNPNLEGTPKGPGLFGIARLAKELNVSIDYLAGATSSLKQSGPSSDAVKLATHALESLVGLSEPDQSITPESLIRTHVNSGGRLEAFQPVLHRCDQYFVPEPNDKFTRVKSIGEGSLSALTMRTTDKDVLQTALEMMEDKALQNKTVNDYRLAGERGVLCTSEELDAQMPNMPRRVRMCFIRTLLLVTDASKERTLLNFSSLII